MATSLSDGYLLTIILAAFAFATTRLHEAHRFEVAFALAAGFSLFQIWRLATAFFPRIRLDGCSGLVSRSYGYAYSLARRRGKSVESETTQGYRDDEEAKEKPADVDDEKVSTTRRIVWHKEYIDSYRHLREHGNSAFIFLLELTLASLAYSVIRRAGLSAMQQLSSIGILFAIWAAPALFVHLLAQHLERRFSHFDRRLEKHVRPKHRS